MNDGDPIFLLHPSLPNYLTITRLVGGGFLLPLMLFYLLPMQIDWLNYLLAGLFTFFSMTDFLDCYLARRYGLETPLGRVLDPIADKFLVCATLIALLGIGRVYFLWVIILIGRELCIMSLRQFAALQNISVPVSYLGKIKSCLQMFWILVLILHPTSSYCSWLEYGLLVLVLYFSLFSLYRYLQGFICNYRLSEFN